MVEWRDLRDNHPAMAALAILMPVYHDSASAAAVIAQVRLALGGSGDVSVVVVDDGSIPAITCADLAQRGAGGAVSVVTLRRNVGHQRAIAIGLAFIAERLSVEAVLVMDADGEDRVEDVPRLLDAWRRTGGTRIVFASRTRRAESLAFRVLYHVYRGLHRLLTGIPVRFGNFSVVPAPLLARLVYSSELWNHYAAAVLKTRLPYSAVPTTRGRRLQGDSRMGLVALVVHGLSALSVFSDTLGVRLLVSSVMGFVLLAMTAAVLAAWQWFGIIHVSPIAMFLGGFVLLVALQIATACALLALVVLGRRTGTDFVPARDYRLFIQFVSECRDAPR